MGLYVGIVLASLRRVGEHDVVCWHLAVALVGLATAVSLGLLLAFSKNDGLLAPAECGLATAVPQ